MTKRKAVYDPVAQQKWAAANREHRNYLSKRSSARSFIRNWATDEDLDELAGLIAERKANGEKTTASAPAIEAESDGVEQ